MYTHAEREELFGSSSSSASEDERSVAPSEISLSSSGEEVEEADEEDKEQDDEEDESEEEDDEEDESDALYGRPQESHGGRPHSHSTIAAGQEVTRACG